MTELPNQNTMTPEQLRAIRPRKDDFYSRRLYNWIKWFSEKRFDRTHCGVKTPAAMQPEEILARLEVRKGTDSGEIYLLLPFGDTLLGCRVGRIRRDCYKNDVFSYGHNQFGRPIKSFWSRYIKKGVCLLNPEHIWIDGPTAWINSPNGKTRTCRWCGLTQIQKSKAVKKTETWWENT